MKVKELLERCKNIIKNAPDYDYCAAHSLKKEDVGIRYKDIEGGKEVNKYWCPHCKSVNVFSGLNVTRCATCGDTIYVPPAFNSCVKGYVGAKARVLYADSEFAVINIIPENTLTWYGTSRNEYTDCEKAHENIKYEIYLMGGRPRYFVYSKEHGLRIVSNNFGQLSREVANSTNSYPFIESKFLDSYKKLMEDSFKKDKEEFGKDFHDDVIKMKSSALSAPKVVSAASKARITREQKRKAEEEASLALVKDNIQDIIFKRMLGFPLAYKFSNNEYVYWCNQCGHHEVRELTEMEKTSGSLYCSSCGKTLERSSKVASEAFCRSDFVDICSDKNGNLAFNFYEGRITYDPEKNQLKKAFFFDGKIACLEKKCLYFNNHLIRTNDKITYPYSYKYPNAKVYDTDKERAVIQNSIWGKIGLTEVYDYYFIEQNDLNYEYLYNYIRIIAKYPIVEQLVKCKCMNLYQWVVNNENWIKDYSKGFINKDATNIRDFFCLSKGQSKLVIDNNMSYSEMQHLKMIQSLDPACSYNDYNWSYTTYKCNQNGANEILDAIRTTSLPVSEIRKYLSSCHYDQCIAWPEITSLWIDYVRMMDKLGFSQKEKKKEMFPSSLKKAHDILNFAVINIYNKEKAKVFDENVNEAKKFEYSFGDFFVKAPDSAEDLVKEGIALNHSVGQHIEYVADGKEYILFIRTKSEPDAPLYTVELLKDEKIIVQVRGNSNRLVKEPEVLEFIKKWAKYKKLIVRSF